jgi:hypothetical protein
MSYVDLMDASAWPVIYARFRGTASVEAFQGYQRWYEAQVRQAIDLKVRIVCINDTTPGVTVSAEVRKYIGDWTAGLSPLTSQASAGDIVVIDSVAMRGVMTALRWVDPKRLGAVETVATPEDAWKRALEQLAAAGQKPPAVTTPVWLKAPPKRA